MIGLKNEKYHKSLDGGALIDYFSYKLYLDEGLYL